MYKPFEAFVGLRYLRAKRRNHFVSFVSLSSILGVALGLMVVITVISIINGFEKSLRERTLEMVSHATLVERFGELSNWRDVARELESHAGITGVAPFSQSEGILFHKNKVNGVFIQGIVPDYEINVSNISGNITAGEFDALKPGTFSIIVGNQLSESLGVSVGDKVILLSGQMDGRKSFSVVGIFETGMYEYDRTLAIIHMNDALALMGTDSPNGLTIKTIDPIQAPYISREAARGLLGQFGIIDWTQRNRNLFHSIKTTKFMFYIILTLIIALAAFNIISTLVMVVVDKQGDIAILRTMGASPGSIMKIFIVQGTIIGLLGMFLGDVLGIWLSGNVNTLIGIVEEAINYKILSCDMYFVCDFPADVRPVDVILISMVAFALCLIATIYPAWRAANVQPAEELRYD